MSGKPLMCMLNHFTYRVGYIRACVWNLKLSFKKIKNDLHCFLAYSQGLTTELSEGLLHI